MDNRYHFFRWFAYVIEIIVFFIVQQTPGLIPAVWGARPMLLLPILVAIALFETEIVGLWFGLFVGVMLDISLWSIVGFYAIIMSVLGFFIGYVAIRFLQSNLLTMMLISALSVGVVYGLYFLFGFVLHFFGDLQYAFLNHYAPRMLYTFALTPIFYFFNKALVMNIREKA